MFYFERISRTFRQYQAKQFKTLYRRCGKLEAAREDSTFHGILLFGNNGGRRQDETHVEGTHCKLSGPEPTG